MNWKLVVGVVLLVVGLLGCEEHQYKSPVIHMTEMEQGGRRICMVSVRSAESFYKYAHRANVNEINRLTSQHDVVRVKTIYHPRFGHMMAAEVFYVCDDVENSVGVEQEAEQKRHCRPDDWDCNQRNPSANYN